MILFAENMSPLPVPLFIALKERQSWRGRRNVTSVTCINNSNACINQNNKMTFYASSYTPPYEETRNRRVKLDLNRLLRVQSMVEIPLISYRDEDIDLSYDPYANEYYSVEMEDELLGSYVNKVVFSTALANGDEIHCVGNCCEGTERSKITILSYTQVHLSLSRQHTLPLLMFTMVMVVVIM